MHLCCKSLYYNKRIYGMHRESMNSPSVTANLEAPDCHLSLHKSVWLNFPLCLGVHHYTERTSATQSSASFLKVWPDWSKRILQSELGVVLRTASGNNRYLRAFAVTHLPWKSVALNCLQLEFQVGENLIIGCQSCKMSPCNYPVKMSFNLVLKR